MKPAWVALAVLLAGCTQSAPGIAISHVHGVAFDASTGNLYLATHHGLARGQPEGHNWAWEYVGDPYDYMGFTQDAQNDGVFYSSGHPNDPRAFGGVHLGLRRSTDGGETWEQRSLKGQVDFHALTSLAGGEGWLAGAWQGAIKLSRDGGLTWTDHAGPPAQILALAGAPGLLLAGTASGFYATSDLDSFGNWTQIPGAGSFISSIAASPDGRTLLAGTGDGRNGFVQRSLDGGLTWAPLTHPLLAQAPAQVLFAFDQSNAAHAFAALASGKLLETRNAGESWIQAR